MPKISVIIPVYNVEAYIEHCSRSLFEQTLDDVEYIYVNDCTPDKSIEILRGVMEEYAHRRDRVQIIHNERNLGRGESRKRGISAATSDFIIHCDPDDWVDKDWLSRLYNKAIGESHDLVWSDYFVYKTGRGNTYQSLAGETDLISVLKSLVTQKRIGSLWSSLVRREIAQHGTIIYPTWNYAEDVALLAQYSVLAQSMGYINDAFYHYRTSETSISRDKTKRREILEGLIASQFIISELARKHGMYERIMPEMHKWMYSVKNRMLALYENDFDAQAAWCAIHPSLRFLDAICAKQTKRHLLCSLSCHLRIYPIMNRIFELKNSFWHYQEK